MKRRVGVVVFVFVCLGVFAVFYEKNASLSRHRDTIRRVSPQMSTPAPRQAEAKRTTTAYDDTNQTDQDSLRDTIDGIDLNSLTNKRTKPYDWLKRMTELYGETYEVEPTNRLNVDLHARMKHLGATYGDRVFVRIFKKESLLEVWIEREGSYRHLKDYAICAWSGRLGPKLKEGDKQAPEGFYRVYRRQLNPKSRYHLAFNLGYPNAYDRAYGRTGSFLMVHGGCRSVGCYAMTDRNIEEIYRLVEAALHKGQPYVPVHIFPFRLTDTALAKYSDAPWFDFWMNLKEGYDYFENTHQVPKMKAEHRRYVVYE